MASRIVTQILVIAMVLGSAAAITGHIMDRRAQDALKAKYGAQAQRWGDMASEIQTAPPDYWKYKKLESNGMMVLALAAAVFFVRRSNVSTPTESSEQRGTWHLNAERPGWHV